MRNGHKILSDCRYYRIDNLHNTQRQVNIRNMLTHGSPFKSSDFDNDKVGTRY